MQEMLCAWTSRYRTAKSQEQEILVEDQERFCPWAVKDEKSISEYNAEIEREKKWNKRHSPVDLQQQQFSHNYLDVVLPLPNIMSKLNVST